MAEFITHSTNAHPALATIIYILALLLLYHWLRVLRLAREGVRHFFLRLFYALAAAYLLVVGFAFVVEAKQPSPASTILGVTGFVFLAAGLIALRDKPQARKRYISRHVRAAVIARDLRGGRYDPSKHHLDHIWPYSKGGSHTVDNLRLLPKSKNLKKGARPPKWWEIW